MISFCVLSTSLGVCCVVGVAKQLAWAVIGTMSGNAASNTVVVKYRTGLFGFERFRGKGSGGGFERATEGETDTTEAWMSCGALRIETAASWFAAPVATEGATPFPFPPSFLFHMFIVLIPSSLVSVRCRIHDC
jgi:hypothetical protein